MTREDGEVLVVVRHAEAEPRAIGGPAEDERPLTARGHRQAEGLVARLQPYVPAAVVSSPYRRAIDTVAPAAASLGLELTVRDDAREWDDGLETVGDWLPRYERSWHDPDHRHGDGETLRELAHRATRCLHDLLARARDRPVVVASHGTWITSGLGGLGMPVSWGFWRAMPLPAVFELAHDDRGFTATGPGLSRLAPTRRD